MVEEGVDGSSPSEGSAKAPHVGAFPFSWRAAVMNADDSRGVTADLKSGGLSREGIAQNRFQVEENPAVRFPHQGGALNDASGGLDSLGW
jgi:hypothetical protein